MSDTSYISKSCNLPTFAQYQTKILDLNLGKSCLISYPRFCSRGGRWDKLKINVASKSPYKSSLGI